MNEPLCKDIWTFQKQNGMTAEVLIIAKHERYVTILTLTDKEPAENAIMVHSISNRYTDAGKLTYTYKENLCDFVKTLTDAEFEKIMCKVATALGLNGFKKPEDEIAQKTSFTTLTADDKITPIQSSGQKIHNLQVELAITQKERDIYKDLFYQAMPQLKSVV